MTLTYLITGAGGQLGSEWVRELESRDVTYHAFGSKEWDITDQAKTEAIIADIKPDVIINTAAYTKVDLAEEEPDQAHKINGEAVEILANLAKKYGSRLVHYSTDYVFPGLISDKLKMPDGYPEDYKTEPINVYGQSKLEGEIAIQQIMSDYLIIRVAWLCGYYGHNFIKTMIKLGKEKDELRVVNDQYGCPTYTANVVHNTLALIHANRYGIFHQTSKGVITWYDLADEIMNQMGYDTNVVSVSSEEYPTKAKRPHFSKLNTDKIESVPGVQIIDWKTGLVQLLAELKNSQDNH